MDDLTDTIEDVAQNPKKVTGDAGSVEEHPLKDLIEADRYGKAQTGADKPHRGLRFTKLIPRGTV